MYHRALQLHGLGPQHIHQDFLQRLAGLGGIADLFALALCAQLGYGLFGGLHAHVRHDQDVGKVLVKIIVQFLVCLHQLIHAAGEDFAGLLQALLNLIKKSHSLMPPAMLR